MSTPLEITVTGDAGGANSALKSVQQELGKTAIAAQNTDKAFANFEKTGNVFAAKIPEAIAKTTDALKNTSHPVVELAQHIKEVGEEGNEAKEKLVTIAAALKKVGGPVGEVAEHAHKLAEGFAEAGIAGLAIGLISVGAHLLSEHLKESAEAAKKNAEELEKAAKAKEEIIDSYAKEISKVDVIVSALTHETLTRKEKKNAIEELQKIAPAYFNTLNAEKSTIDEITAAYDKYNKSIVQSITAKVREKDLEGVIKRITELEDKKASAGKQQIFVNGKLIEVINARMGSLEEEQSAMKNNSLLTNKEVDELENLYLTRKKLADLVAQGEGPGVFDKAFKEEHVKKVETIADIIKKLRSELAYLNNQELVLKVDRSKEKITELENAIKALTVKFGLNGSNPIIVGLYGEIKEIQIKEQLLANKKFKLPAFEFELPTLKVGQVIQKGIFERRLDEWDKYVKEQKKRLEHFRGIVSNLGESIGSAFGEGIATAIQGGGIKSFFNGIFKAVGSGLKQLGAYFIASSKLIATIKKTIVAAPQLALIGGVALVALGSIIESAASKNAFATGVRNFKGGTALVGERGPELVTLPTGSNVIPNGQLNAMGSQEISISGEFVQRGTDMVLVLNRAQAQLRRNG